MALYLNSQRIGGGLRRFWMFALAMALFIGMAQSALAAGPYTVVTPTAPDGWQPRNVRTDATVGITTAQPRGDAPNNLGSLEFTTNTVTNSQDKADYVKYWGVVAGRTLGNLSTLSYELYRASSSTTAQHFVPAFRLAYQTTGGQLGYLVWEDVYNGGSTSTAVLTNQWLAKDIFAGNFWMRNGPTTVEQYDVTLAQWESGATFPGSQPLDANTNIIGIEIGVGSGWGDTFTGYVDNVAASFGSDSVTANFEPDPVVVQCTTTCYVNGTTGSNTNGGTSASDAKQTIQAALNQVSPNGTVIIAAGTYTENTTINKDGLIVQGAGKGLTIIQGDGTTCAAAGVTLSGSRSNIRLEDFTVTGFLDGIQMFTGPLTNIVVEDVAAVSNCRHGVWSQAFGINGLRFTRVTASSNNLAPNAALFGRGIFIINGVKQNITIEDGVFNNNRLVGVDVSDGNVTGLAITGNEVTGNGDSGIGVLGAQGPSANLVSDNTVTNNGRFGIEIKNSTGSGSDSGAGSLLVSSNIVSRNTAAADLRDYAGIVVMRRAPILGNNADQPTGTVVANNEVRGYHRAAAGSTGDGFGIVVEGLNNVVKNNIVTDNDVGIQVQGGNTADIQNNEFFDRGDAAQGDALVNRNAIAGNGIGLRTVGTITPTPLDATNNWWGANTGPTNAGNPGGTGDSVVGSNVDYDPWLCSGQDTSAATGFQPNSQTSPCALPAGTLTVTKYNDKDGSHARNGSEPGLSGWTITVKQGTTTITSGTTDGSGNVTFTGLTPGSYTVCETQQSGWQNTDPSNGSGCKTATVTANATTNVALGNKQQPQGTLTVTKYNDLNRNGSKGSSEPGLSGWTITVKQGANVITSGTTDSNGNISFSLAPGSYKVCETQQSGWQNTDPSNGSGCKDVTVTANKTTSVKLGNAQQPQKGTLAVTKYNDLNRNGKRDSGEPGLSGWTITVKQGNTTVAAGTTDGNGNISFSLAPASYKVCEAQQANWQNTDPSDGSGCKTVTVTKNGTATVVLGNAPAPANPAPAQPGKIYAVNDGGTSDSQLFTVNLSSPNTVAALGPLYKGYDLEGLDIHPTTGTIYVTSGGDNAYGQRGWLYKVDSITGALTAIGSTGQKEVESLAFAPNGELWGWAIGKGLIKINLTTGASTLIFKDSKDVEGLAFSNDGSKVYAASGKKLYVYTLSTGKIVELAANLPGMTEALEMRPDGKLLLGVDGSKVIYVYDPSTKQVITAQNINVAPYSDVEGIGYSAS